MLDQDDDIDLLQQLIAHGGTQAFSLVPAALKKVIKEKQWKHRTDKNGKTFETFEAFATHRLWQGLETTIDDLRVFCRKDKTVQRMILEAMEPEREHGGDRKSDQMKDQGDNITLNRGTSALYTLKRLKRDHPDLFEQVIGGAMSANAAAFEAGFRKPPSPLKQLRKVWAKASEDDRAQFLAEVTARKAVA